jgi:hypothetical protein
MIFQKQVFGNQRSGDGRSAADMSPRARRTCVLPASTTADRQGVAQTSHICAGASSKGDLSPISPSQQRLGGETELARVTATYFGETMAFGLPCTLPIRTCPRKARTRFV